MTLEAHQQRLFSGFHMNTHTHTQTWGNTRLKGASNRSDFDVSAYTRGLLTHWISVGVKFLV